MSAPTKRGNALLERRMAHEQPLQSMADRTADAERSHLVRQRLRTLLAQAFERADHRVATFQLRAAGVGAELALAREPHDDHAREDAEHDLRDDHGDEKRGAMAALGLEHDAVNRVTDDARQEDDEGIHHALD